MLRHGRADAVTSCSARKSNAKAMHKGVSPSTKNPHVRKKMQDTLHRTKTDANRGLIAVGGGTN